MMRNRFLIVYYTEGSKRAWAVLGFLTIFQIDYIWLYAACRLYSLTYFSNILY